MRCTGSRARGGRLRGVCAALVSFALLHAPGSASGMGCQIVLFSDVLQKASLGPDGAAGRGAINRTVVGPGEYFSVFADLGCDPTSPGFSQVLADHQATLFVRAKDGTFVQAPLTAVEVLGCPDGQTTGCSGLTLQAPADGTLAGPAGVQVRRTDLGGELVVSLAQLAAPGASCDPDVPDPVTGGLVLAPAYNPISEGSLPNLRGAVDWLGNLVTPLDMTALVDQPGSPQAVLTQTTGISINLVPVQEDYPGESFNFVRVLSDRGRPIPPLAQVVREAPAPAFTKLLLASTDVVRSHQQILAAVELSDQSQLPFPVDFQQFRTGAGPVIAPAPVVVEKLGTTNLSAFRASSAVFVAGLLEQQAGDLNLDGDANDQVAKGQSLALGAASAETGLALAEISGSARRTATAADETGLWAFVQSGFRSREELTGVDSFARNALQVFRDDVRLTPAAPLPPLALGGRVEDGLFSLSDGIAFSLTSEPGLLPTALEAISDDAADSRRAALDAAGRRVAYERSDGDDPAQVLVADREAGGIGARVSPPAGAAGNADALRPALSRDGLHVAFESRATNYPLAAGGGEGGSSVIWERGSNVAGVLNGGGGFFPDASLIFELEPGEAFPGSGDWSECTADAFGPLPVGVELIFVDDPGFVETGEFRARLVAPVPGGLAPDCRFDITVEGSYVASQSPPQPGTAITLQGAITPNELLPPLPAGFASPSFESTLIVGGPFLGGLRLDGFFAALAQVGASTLAQQIYLAGTGSGSFARVSVSSSGAPGDGDSSNADLGADGRCLVFDSEAENLVPGDGNGARDVFGVDLDADGDGILAETDEPGAVATVRLSATAAGGELSGPSFAPRVSADCERVLYLTAAPDAVPGDANDAVDAVLLLRDADGDDVLDEFGQAGAVALVRVSLDAAGQEVAGDVIDADLSGSGRFAVFTAAAGAGFVPDDTNANSDVYLVDLEDGVLERVSLDIGRAQVAADSRAAALSDDETAVVFESDGALVPGDPPGTDVYRFDRLTADLELLTAVRTGASGAGAPAPNGDGLVVALDSADPLVPGDGGAPQDVFVAFRGDDGGVTSLNHFPLAGWPDADLSDRVLEAFDSDTGSYLPGAHIAAVRVETAAGMAVVQVREASQGGVDLNTAALTRLPESAASDEDDADDDVAFLYRARPDDRLVNLGVAVAGGDLSAEVACLVVDEAGQSTVLNGDGAADDGVLAWIGVAGGFGAEAVHNTGIAAAEVRAVDAWCVALVPESAGVGGLAGLCSAQGPAGCDLNGDGDFDDLGAVALRTGDGVAFNLGVAAVAFDFGPAGNAIVVTDEAGDGTDLNGDGLLDDQVPQYLNLGDLGGPPVGPGPGERGRLRPLGPAWTRCDEPACGAFPAISRVGESFVSYTGFESDNAFGPFCQTGQLSICDSNDDGRQTRVVWVAAIANRAVSRLQSLPFEPEQETDAFPTEVGGKRTLYREWTECQAAAFRCGREGFVLPSPLPASIPVAPQACEAAVDIAPPFGELGCSELVLYIAGDGDTDGVLDPVDNAPLVFNDDQADSDQDGWGDVIDPNQTQNAVERFGCDFDQDADVDQNDVDVQLARLGQPSTDAASEALGVAGGDALDLNLNWRIDIGDVRACVARCTQPGCPVIDPGVAATGGRCGLLGVEALLPLLALAGRRRSWRRRAGDARNGATQNG